MDDRARIPTPRLSVSTATPPDGQIIHDMGIALTDGLETVPVFFPVRSLWDALRPHGVGITEIPAALKSESSANAVSMDPCAMTPKLTWSTNDVPEGSDAR